MFDRLIQYYNILKKITINRNKFFMSNYQKILILLLRIRLRLSMAYNFKMNRQTKKIKIEFGVVFIILYE